MLYVPCRTKPKYGDAGIIPAHPLTPKFALMLNESGGNTVYDLISKKPYGFYASGGCVWDSEGVRSTSDYSAIVGPALNTIFPASCDGTIIIHKKFISRPTTYGYAFSAGTGFANLSLSWDPVDSIGLWISNIQLSTTNSANWETAKCIAVTWKYGLSGTGIVKFYRDGVFIGSKTNTVNLASYDFLLNIGGRTDSTGRYIGGDIISFYATPCCLSDAEIASLSNNPYLWLYSKSEQLLYPQWVVSGGGGSIVPIIMQNMNQFNGGMI